MKQGIWKMKHSEQPEPTRQMEEEGSSHGQKLFGLPIITDNTQGASRALQKGQARFLALAKATTYSAVYSIPDAFHEPVCSQSLEVGITPISQMRKSRHRVLKCPPKVTS